MADEVTIATDGTRAIEGIVPAQHWWLFTRRGEKGQPLLALHPRRNNDDYRRVTFLAEATRPADLIVVDHAVPFSGGKLSQTKRSGSASE